ncbi:hypothetical protein OAO87_03130 [bacterium]|nr:hypothetical protein [bacterium]
MLSRLSEQRASSHRADAVSEHLRRCYGCLSKRASSQRADAIAQRLRCYQGCLSGARQAIELTPSPSICHAVTAV